MQQHINIHVVELDIVVVAERLVVANMRVAPVLLNINGQVVAVIIVEIVINMSVR